MYLKYDMHMFNEYSNKPVVGTCRTAGVAPKLLTIILTVLKKSAPMRSILLTKQIRGTPYLSACTLQTHNKHQTAIARLCIEGEGQTHCLYASYM